jgi:hypothetical protein
MEMNGQLHATATLSPEKEPLLPIGQEADLVAVVKWKENHIIVLAGNRTSVV